MEEIFSIKGLRFDFRNKYKYMDYVDNLKAVLELIIPDMEKYLETYNPIDYFREKNIYDKVIHFSVTDSLQSGKE